MTGNSDSTLDSRPDIAHLSALDRHSRVTSL